MHRKPLRMQTKKHPKNNSKKLRGWVLSQSLFCVRIYNFPSHVPHTPCRAGQERMLATVERLCRTACAALGTSPSFDAQPTLLSFIAHQRNFGSRQTHGEKHRNPARGQRNFWLLFLPWKSNTYNVCHKAAISTEILRTPKRTFGYFSFHGKVT